MQAMHDVDMAQMRVDMRQAQQDVRQAQTTTKDGNHNTRFDLVDVKTMSPSIFNVFKTDHFKARSKKLVAYCNIKVNGYREALEAAQKCKTVLSWHAIVQTAISSCCARLYRWKKRSRKLYVHRGTNCRPPMAGFLRLRKRMN